MPATQSATISSEVARSFFTAYNAHDVEKMLKLCSHDAELRYVPMGNRGRGAVRELGKMIWAGLIEALPDLRVTVQSLFGNERHAAAEVIIGGTQKKDIQYGNVIIPNQGKRYDLEHAFLLKLNDSALITEVASYWDNASFYLQLGKTTLELPT